MKKFLSLVLAMIMTMSLVTISAGATEYKDLTDKDEIQYEEAVAVLNRIGVITGYDDGSFRPETELTRGAAAKIIVSLLIGPEAANALPNVSSPYPDVPASHTFAGVISFCKTSEIISGYGDGTFKPANPLTGYAFAKMLLGAIGYNSDIEGFTGSGWTMNVAKVGNVAGLFDRISFDGAAAVTRDQACQLALNTLKATLVTYGGTSIVNGSTGSYTIQGTQANPMTSNNRDINANIGRKDWYGGNNQNSDYLTLEFGEEHFKDLRLEHDRFDPAHDDFGRPSNQWSYKKVTIGTFPLEADYTYTTQVAHLEDSDGTKEKALGLRNYDLVADGGYSFWNGGTWWNSNITPPSISNNGITNLWRNGLEDSDFFATKNKDGKFANKVANIADFTDNGTLVEVYVSSVDADWITDVVVIQTQLMEVKKVASDYVTLDQLEPDVRDGKYYTGDANIGFNQYPIDVKVEQVKDTNEDCYEILNGLKEGDEVAVIPVTTDGGKTYEAAKVYAPETVSGTLTRVDTYGVAGGKDDRGAIEITVGGTSYKIADWNKDMWDLTLEKIKATRKDVTLLMDEYGNAMLAKDVGSTNDFMVIGDFYQALSGNKICTYVHGWDISGTELDLNLGSTVKVANHGADKSVYGHVIGELVRYSSEGATGDADYVLGHKDVYDVYTNLKNTNGTLDKVSDENATFEIKASNLLVPLADKRTEALGGGTIDGSYRVYDPMTSALSDPYTGVVYHNYYFDKGVKFIYVTMDESENEVDSIEFKSGAQNVTQAELREDIMQWAAQGCVKNDQVKAVVIKRESNDASLDKMLYVTNYFGMKEYDKETGEKGFEVEALMYKDGKWTEGNRIIIDKDLRIGAFATYSARESAKYAENYYHVKNFYRTNANPSVMFSDAVSSVDVAAVVGEDARASKALLRLTGDTFAIDATGAATSLKLKGIASNDPNFSKPDADESYVLGDYRGVSTTIDSAITKPQGIIVTKNAYFLNMVSDKRTYVDETGIERNWRDLDIDDTEDLIDLVLDKGYKASVTVLLNEKADSDGFRTAYLVVINDITGTGTGSADESYTGAVSYDTGLSTAVDGAISNDSVIVRANGRADIKFTLSKPDWAYLGAGVNTVNVSYDIYMDDETIPYTSNTETLTSGDYKTVSVNTNLTSLITVAEAKGHKLSAKITDVEWPAARVEFFDKDGKTLPTVSADTNAYLTTSNTAPGGAIKFHVNTSDSDPATWSVQNASALTGKLTSGVSMATVATAVDTTDGYCADGGKVVKVTVDVAVKRDFALNKQGAASAFGPTALKSLTGVTVSGLDGSADLNATLGITSSVASAAEGTTGYYYDIAIAGHTDTLVKSFEVTYTLTGCANAETKTVTIENLGSGGSSARIYTGVVNATTDLTVTAVKANVVTFKIVGATVDADKKTVTVSFTDKADHFSSDAAWSTAGTAGAGNHITVTSGTVLGISNQVVNADGTITFECSGTLSDGATILIDAPVENASGEQVKAGTITLKTADGGTTWTSSVTNK